MNFAIILGTRPEIIKMSPVIRECERKHIEHFILHTGQHYSYNMDMVFFEQLGLPDAKYNLDVGSGAHGEQTGKMLEGIEKVLMMEKPDAVLVQGDTNTVLAGALAAVKLGIKVGHVEAGLRSYDRRMPEEINRVLADHSSDYLFAPTEKSKNILLHEGIPESRIFVTGNTIVDAVHQNLKIAKEKNTLNELDIKQDYFLVTAHRQENVDDPVRFTGIIAGLERLSQEFNIPVIYPIHPRSRKRIQEFGIKINGSIILIDPVDFLDFLQLESNARLVLTDSGGVQEETCILGVPCVTLRDNTERPETIEVGSNVLAGTEPGNIVECARDMLERGNKWNNPFGDGKAAERIGRVIKSGGMGDERKVIQYNGMRIRRD
ncbi:MAG: UDP-N-acetylglucosamine 2-epimerase (non-hydrolyzing) [Candidatus Methanoperedens sp.]|nr:UDP-N-acetylglucosamine 2-epimerase (non-hydrolyzing) [Candidatus Methanoperedens sp.]